MVRSARSASAFFPRRSPERSNLFWDISQTARVHCGNCGSLPAHKAILEAFNLPPTWRPRLQGPKLNGAFRPVLPAPSFSFRRARTLRELIEKVVRVEPDCPRNVEELDHVQPSFAPFVLGDVGLGPSEPPGQRSLGEPRRLALLDQLLLEPSVLVGEDRFGHELAPRVGASLVSLELGLCQNGFVRSERCGAGGIRHVDLNIPGWSGRARPEKALDSAWAVEYRAGTPESIRQQREARGKT